MSKFIWFCSFLYAFICIIHIDDIYAKDCSIASANLRFDCYPEADGASQEKCEERGCCWQPTKSGISDGEPYCFYPTDFPSYNMSTPQETAFGYTAMLKRTNKSYYPNDILTLQLDIYLETESRIHFKIYDPMEARYEVPIPTPKVTKKAASTNYDVKFRSNPFAISIIRKSNGEAVFNTSFSPLIFADQFIQLSSSLTSKNLYGLGEHQDKLAHDLNWQRFVFWARDQPPDAGNNLYGSHPFYLNMDSSGNTHGVFLLNSNAMEVVLQPTPAITYRTIGGILDFYIFLGPKPEAVVQQYTEVIGRSYMPPYWGLGFHLCRWGYGSAENTLSVVEKMRAAGIPQDSQWNDIDYMDSFHDWTYDKTHYSTLPSVPDDLHKHNQHYIMIIDPGIASTATDYAPYDDGIKEGVFVKDYQGKPIIGSVWPGNTAFPDFFNPAAVKWWEKWARNFHDQVEFDGMWIDMNEPSNMIDGSTNGCPSNSTYENPPYVPKVTGGKLWSKTLCMTAKHYTGLHYNLHNLYGYSEMVATHQVLINIRNKRPFIISRSTFPGSGQYGGHWLGDNDSAWSDMYYSITGILSFSFFGIPLVGADICGFNGNSNEELCQRWMQLGAFYPFSRNHNSIYCPSLPIKCKDQDPTAFSKAMQKSTAKALSIRYALLPYLYTLFYHSHINGSTVARPLFFEFPDDSALRTVDKQFLWGPALMISPVLTQGATTVDAMIPSGIWYDLITGETINMPSTQSVRLDAPLDKINLHVRAGHILPWQYANTTTTVTRMNDMNLLVALDANGLAAGDLYWDDGDSLDTIKNGKYSTWQFKAVNQEIKSYAIKDGFTSSSSMLLGEIKIFGITTTPAKVLANGKQVKFTYDSQYKVLTVTNLRLPFNKMNSLVWS
ncbi:lysosomal alpha-glucosidase-like isoform X2 [Anneissia japonica]|uniref:lysosomal alpha-glucosidase-like isoform X1 n=1 Tax=Anneissia japonica TaxID=1529436 RepID=UPI001425B129|nr:lysosomal alpha-glucosidase-like isoform X1 [Anneissia japonica]XP_033124430.1 lysosomal alpha-glucosidase-like isoform X2 [Anneissia japonica]